MLWSSSDIKDDKRYCLDLCYADEGDRFFQLVEYGSDKPSNNVFARTEIVDNTLLKKRGTSKISRETLLNSGDRFYVDPHGVWITQNEDRQLKSGVEFRLVEWETGKEPVFAPTQAQLS